MTGKKILLIDDDKSIHSAVRALTSAAGHQLISALDAMQGVMMARQNRPDLIVLDINMPAGGGVAVYERLRALSGTLQIPILIYTAVPLDEIRAKVPESADTVMLAKPASLEALQAAIARLLPA